MPKAKKQDRITHLSRVVFEGYKSIDHLEIDLVKGLNIIIGPNGSGKSNFLEALYATWYWFLISPMGLFLQHFKSSDIILVTERKRKIRWYTKTNHPITAKNVFLSMYSEEKLIVDGKTIIDYSNNESSSVVATLAGRQALEKINIVLKPFVLVRYNLPLMLIVIDTPGSIERTKHSLGATVRSTPMMEDLMNYSLSRTLIPTGSLTKNKLNKEEVLNKLRLPESVVLNLNKFSPIKDLRFSPNLNIYQDENRVSINNIILEFYVNNSWVPWSYLSDGTKRLFYLISEISYFDNGIILIEEPELGVHPDQFHLIMNFLKEQAEDKQIIMSTHSPEALNILDENELGNIIVTKYNKKKGTTMSHISKKQAENAKKYMKKEGFLSDYWLQLDLEG